MPGGCASGGSRGRSRSRSRSRSRGRDSDSGSDSYSDSGSPNIEREEKRIERELEKERKMAVLEEKRAELERKREGAAQLHEKREKREKEQRKASAEQAAAEQALKWAQRVSQLPVNMVDRINEYDDGEDAPENLSLLLCKPIGATRDMLTLSSEWCASPVFQLGCTSCCASPALQPASLVLLHRSEIEEYLRVSFEIHKTIKKIGLRMTLKLEGESKFVTTARDPTTLSSFWGLLEGRSEAVLVAKVIELSGSVISVQGPKTIKKASRPRDGKQREDETNFKALVAALFGERPGHCAEGAWTASASDVMRRQPEYLTTFHADRELVKRVLGDGRFLVTPCTLACPFESAVCTKGCRRLNRFGGISQMFKHWEKRHGDNPAAKQLIARFKAILKNKRLTMAQLDAKAPLVLEGEAEDGYEQVRSLDAIASEDLFTYDFEMHSDEHREWLAAVGSI
jgi:hypothetical protein